MTSSLPHLARGTAPDPVEDRVRLLLGGMSLEEKVGQLHLVNGRGGHVDDELAAAVRGGRVGAVLNEVDVDTVNELQRLAVEESRLGIPLLVGRDVIHGFRTVFPIPLGQAATWDPDLVSAAARVAALEAARAGVNWTFAPMVDIGRDPRWGRVAETLGEDPYLAGVLSAAMVDGFQGPDLSDAGSLATCVKHFAGYGASEAGRDYNTTNIPERELRDVHLPPFKAALEAGSPSVMASFSDLDGIPASANAFLLTRILREEWGFTGFVVSDWDAIPQLVVHGIADDRREAASKAATAGIDVDMAGHAYAHHLADLVREGAVDPARLDAMVAAVLRTKARLGLFDEARTRPEAFPAWGHPRHLDLARDVARRSVVLLKNDAGVLPLDAAHVSSLAVIGPLADAPAEQLGTWVFDGDAGLARTPLAALRDALSPDVHVRHVRALPSTRSHDEAGFDEAEAAARDAEAAILVLGEEAILSGEAHCRADIRLPGAQEALVRRVARTGTPVIAIVMAGRPLALDGVVEHVESLLFAWHPGTMAGPALADLLLGEASPSGKLPVTLPRVPGQIPVYYAHKNTGRPPSEESFVHIDDIPPGATQLSVGNTSFHLDTHYTPLYPFGHGLSYGAFEYRDFRVEPPTVRLGEEIRFRVDVTNVGHRSATEVVQLYVRDPVASVTRPVRELKAFRRVPLDPGETATVRFVLHTDDLAFHGAEMRRAAEPGAFRAWVGGSSEAALEARFQLTAPEHEARGEPAAHGPPDATRRPTTTQPGG
jgi:beta-glucosidase